MLIAIFVVLVIAENKRRLRKKNQPKWKRTVINGLVSLPAFSLLRWLLLPMMISMANKSQDKRWGLNYRYAAHPLIKTGITFLLLDYTNYLWHVLLHRLPILWRFHVVHHSDPDLDITTALRFHFGEIIASVLYRGGCVFLIGAKPLQVLIYEIVFEGATQFHHSNWQLPIQLERALNKIIVTPRMHGIHHSMIRQETDSNYSVVFSFWDRLHKTIRLNVPQNTIVTGVPSYSNHAELTIGYLLRLPFTNIRKWDEVNDQKDVSTLKTGRNRLAE